MAAVEEQEVDDFGLPLRKYVKPNERSSEDNGQNSTENGDKKEEGSPKQTTAASTSEEVIEEKSSKESNGLTSPNCTTDKAPEASVSNSDSEDFQDAPSTPLPETTPHTHVKIVEEPNTPTFLQIRGKDEPMPVAEEPIPHSSPTEEKLESQRAAKRRSTITKDTQAISGPSIKQIQEEIEANKRSAEEQKSSQINHSRENSKTATNHDISEFSHQQLTAPKEENKEDGDEDWQTMPAYAPYDIYDDDNKLVAREHNPDEDDTYGYAGLGGAGKGYTRVIDDEDAQSETSMDDNTRYLFSQVKSTSMTEMDEDQRDALSQLQATKDLLTEGQRIAYVGIARLELATMVKGAESVEQVRKVKKDVQMAVEAMKMWSQKIMVRLYAHMEISPAEQVMIEQLAEHGVIPQDLTPTLMQNARVKNPMAEDDSPSSSSPKLPDSSPRTSASTDSNDEPSATPPPAYETHEGEEMPEVRTPTQLPTTEKIDIDLRWTVLCDLFLVLIADSIYDARSRVLLEQVGKALEVPWIDICRFEKRVTDALEMQQQAEKENWNEEEHLENRRKLAIKRRYVMMGIATVGGGLVIGLSAGLLAPLIGAGLAAGFTTIGVTGTSSFLAGAGGAAIITSGATTAGSIMGGKAAGRRMGSVRTFEYRPLHNNKRVNLIVTISGWMTSTNDDVRLPFSTVDPVMGDLYSILWEPEMLTSMGDTINILATEALTQGLQQVLGSTILIGLMAALQLPVVLSKLTYLIDNPWAVSQDRAWAAGLILADSLIDRNLGTRPITLVGYSLGARVIFSCLLELARKGAYGLVQNVYMFGSPIVVKKEEYLKVRTIVAGRFVNGYNRTDWILGYLFRLTNGGIRRVAGLASVDECPGIENFDCTEYVAGHMQYRTAMPRILRELGWSVESDEFGEIEDPDPEKHRERQKELLNEIEEARKELEQEGKAKKGVWGIFGRKKKNERAEWEIYEESKGSPNGVKTEVKEGNNPGVLFDVDAIRAELAKDQELQVKELASTLPPMKLELSTSTSPRSRDHARDTKSEIAGSSNHGYTSFESRSSQERTPTARPYSRLEDGYHSSPPPRPEKDQLQMSFDTEFSREPEQPPKPPSKDHSLAYGNSTPSLAASRPEIKTSHTTPNLNLTDPWADVDLDDDDDFGKEKEISMTFA